MTSDATHVPQPESGEIFSAIDRELTLARILNESVVVTWWLLVSNVVIWIAAKSFGVLYMTEDLGLVAGAFNAEQLVLYTGMKVNEHVAAGEWWRLASSMWVHLDILHLAFNAYGLYVLGPILEKFYGGRRLWVLYIISGLVGAWASFYFNDIPSGGASGAIYGMVGALLVFGFKYRGDLPDRVSRAFTVGMLPWVLLSIGIGFFEAIPLDNAAHIGGLVSGGLLALVLGSRLSRERTREIYKVVLTVLSVIGVAAVIYTMAMWTEEVTECTDSRADYIACYPEIEKQVTGKAKPQKP